MLVEFLTDHGLTLIDETGDPLSGGARGDDLTAHILPEGTKRRRQTIRRYYMDGQSGACAVSPDLTEEEVVQSILRMHGLCTLWTSCAWRDRVLYIESSRPTVNREQFFELFRTAEAIMQAERPVARLGSRTVVLGLRGSGPTGISVAAVRQAAAVRRLNLTLGQQIKSGTWTSIALVKHGCIPEHIDSLDENLAFMISTVAPGSQFAQCRLCFDDPVAEVNTVGRWCAFNPLLLHSVRASENTLSVVLYSASRGVRQQDVSKMAELGFPGWVHVDDTSDEVNGHQVPGERTQRLAQTFSVRHESSSNVYLDPAGSTDAGSSSTSGSTSGTTSGKTSPNEISPTLPFTGGQAWSAASSKGISVALYDPDLPGECVFQSMLWSAGFDTTLTCCTAARATVACLVAQSECLPQIPLLHGFLAGSCSWRDPVRVRRWGCIADIICLPWLGMCVCVHVVVGDSTLFEFWPPGCSPGSSCWTCLGYDGSHYCVLARRKPVPIASVFVPDLTEEGIEPNPGPPKADPQSAGPQTNGSKSAGRPPSAPGGKASNKRKAAVVKKLLHLGVDFTAHQLRTLVSADGACDRLENAQSAQQSKDILNALYLKSGFRKEEPHPETADDLPTIQVEISEDVEIGFQVKPSLMQADAEKPDTTKGMQGPQGATLRAFMLKLLQNTVHPVAEAAETSDADKVLINDAVVVRCEEDYIAGRCWVAGDMATVLGLSGVHGIFFNPPIALQAFYRVVWSDEAPAALFETNQSLPNFAGIVLAKDKGKYGVRSKTGERKPVDEEWEVKGLPLKLTEKAVVAVLSALGISDPKVRREMHGWRLAAWEKYPVPVPLTLDSDQSKHKVKAGSEVFVVWFKRCGWRSSSSTGAGKGSSKGSSNGARSRSKSRRPSRGRDHKKTKVELADPVPDADEFSDAHFEKTIEQSKALQSGAKRMKAASDMDVASMAQRMVDMQLLMARMAQQVQDLQAASKPSEAPIAATLEQRPRPLELGPAIVNPPGAAPPGVGDAVA
eukprot:288131-Amphidinium_carterae.1